MRRPISYLLLVYAIASATIAAAIPGAGPAARGAFTVSAIGTGDAADCATASGTVTVTIDASDPGQAPYDVSLDDGATWATLDAAADAAGGVRVEGVRWGTYAVAVRDASEAIVYPGYARVGGCVIDACSRDADDFAAVAVDGATGYTWTTELGTVASGQGTRIVTLDLAGLPAGATAEVCVQPTGPSCSAPATCFGVRVTCAEVCGNGLDDDGDGIVDEYCIEDCTNGVDDDGDGLIDCEDPDCGNAAEVYFSAAGPSKDPRSLVFSTAPSWASRLRLDVATVSFERPLGTVVATPPGAEALVFNPRSLHFLEAIAASVWPAGFSPAGFTIDERFGDFAGEDCVFVTTGERGTGQGTYNDPDDAPDAGPVYDAAGHQGHGTNYDAKRFSATTTFEVDDLNAYRAYFADVRLYVDGNIVLKVNGDSVAVAASTAGTPWYRDPGPVTRIDLQPRNLRTGTNQMTIEFYDEVSGESIGVSGFAGFARLGAYRQGFALDAAPVGAICPGETAELSVRAIGGTAPYQYRWSAGAGDTREVAVAPAATTAYTVTVTDAQGCSLQEDVMVIVRPTPTATAVTEDAACGLDDGAVVVTLPDESAGTMVQLSLAGGSATPVTSGPIAADGGTYRFEGLSAGEYVLGAAWDGGVCPTTIGSFTVREADGPTVAISAPATVCAGETVELVAVPGGGAGPYTYRWSDGQRAARRAVTPPAPAGADQTVAYEVTVTDANGCTASASHQLRVRALPTASFRVTDATCGRDNGTVALSFADVAAEETIAFSLDGGATWPVAIADGAGGYTVNELAAGSYELLARWGDGACAVGVGTAEIRDRTAPTLAPIVDQVVCPGTDVTLVAAANGGKPPYRYAWSDGLGTGATVNLTAAATAQYTVTVTDDDGCTASEMARVVAVDDAPPVFAAFNPSVEVACDGAEAVPAPTAADGCGEVVVTSSDVRRAETCANAYEIVRTYRATDASGNVATATRVITVRDTTPPVFAAIPADATVGCGGALPTDLPMASDACDGAVAVTVATDTLPGGCPLNAQVRRRFRAIDACGNVATAVQFVTVATTTGPTFADVPADVGLGCGDSAPTALPSAMDACGAPLRVSERHTTVSGRCEGVYRLTRIFSAEDACGRVATTQQVLTYADDGAPAFVTVPADITLDCGSPSPTALATAVDECDGRVVVTVTETSVAGPCGGSTLRRTFRATDDCGNAVTAEQVVTFEDTTAPVLGAVPPAVTLACGEPLPATTPTAVDGCGGRIEVVATASTTAGACGGATVTIRTFTASDECGNAATASQVVTYEDTAAPAFAAVPADTTLDCGAAPVTALPTATDACDGAVAVTVTETTAAGACGGTRVVTRVFTATDACGNAATARQVVTYEDTAAPVFAAVPADVTLACGAAAPTALPKAVDACDGPVTVGVTENRRDGASASDYVLTRTFTATDACGNVATAQQVVTAVSGGAPRWTSVPVDITLACGTNPPSTLATAADACDEPLPVTVSEVRTEGACANAYLITRVFATTDLSGNAMTTSQVVTYEDTAAPVFAAVPADITLACGTAAPTALPTATDACDGAVAVTVTETTAAGACGGTRVVTRVFTATDACGNAATARQVVTYEDTAAPVFAAVPADVTLACGAPAPTAFPTAADACSGPVAVTVSETRGPGASDQDSVLTRTFRAVDACGNVASAQQVVTYGVGRQPDFTYVPGDVTLACGAALPAELATAEAACGEALAVSVAETRVDGACANAYVVRRVFTATTAGGEVLTTTQVVTYEDTTPPVLSDVPRDATLACGAARPAGQPTAVDACDGEVVVTTTETVIPGTCDGNRELRRVFTATDACGNVATAEQVVTVRDVTPPTFESVPADALLACGTSVPTTSAVATDDCGGEVIVTETLVSEEGPCAGSRVVRRVFTATDACGNAATATQVLTVEDRTAPQFTAVPADVTLPCGQAAPSAIPDATDACGDALVEVTVEEEMTPGSCAGSFTLTRTFTAADACGNVATTRQVVRFTDTRPPTLVDVPADVTVTCGETLPTAVPTAQDDCDDGVAVAVTETRTPGTDAASYVLTRRFTATDACGNVATAEQVVSYRESGFPQWRDVPADVTLSCEAAVPTALAQAEDACGRALPVSIEEVRTAGECAGAYTVRRVFTAIDRSGATVTTQQVVRFTDATAPVLADVPPDVTLACGTPAPTALPTATDACDARVEVRVTATSAPGSCRGTTVLTRVFTATDACGNATTARQTVTFGDTVAPVLVGVPADVTLACGSPIPAALPTADDACATATVSEARSQVPGACAGTTVVTRVFTAVDACGNTATAAQVVTLEDRTAPVFGRIEAEVVLGCGASAPAATPEASDACSTVTVTFAEDAAAGACAGARVLTRVWTATDACGNTATVSQRVRFEDDTPPSWTEVPPTTTVPCGGDLPEVLATAQDACGSLSDVSYSDTRVAGDCANGYDIVRTFTVSDACGNVATTEQLIRVRDDEAPTLANVPADVALRCDAPLPTAMPSANDACGGDVTVTETLVREMGACASDAVYVRVFTATDACGNVAEARQRVTRYDDVAPVFSTTVSDIEIACGQATPTYVIRATDNCDLDVSVSYMQYVDASSDPCFPEGVLMRVWTAVDNCGNTAEMRQRVTTVDRVAPVLMNVPRSVTVDCDAPLVGARPTATDACGGEVAISFEDVATPNECGRTVRRTWIAEDRCGNRATALQTILVVDAEPPVITTTLPEAITLACGRDLPAVAIAAADACDERPVVAEELLELGPGACPGERVVLRVFTVTDDCGNQALLTQQVTFVDEAAPRFAGVPPDQDVACEDADWRGASPEAIDGCGGTVAIVEASAEETVVRGGVSYPAIRRTWTATDGCGNAATAEQLVVLAGGSAGITVLGPGGRVAGAICAGDEVTLVAPAGGRDYRWSTGETTAVIRVRPERTRVYTVSYGGACGASVSVEVAVAPRPTFRLAAVPRLCEGQDLRLAAETTVAGVTWRGPWGFTAVGAEVTLADLSVAQSGNYYATAAAPSGCVLVDSVYVGVSLEACGEVCGNGLDDDGDGLVDCADPDCACCTLGDVLLTTTCDDGGTGADPSDDRYAVFAELVGEGVAGRAFRVTGDVELAAIYAGTKVLLGAFPVERERVSFDFASVSDSACALRDRSVLSPGPCTPACYLEVVSVTPSACAAGQYDLAVTVRYANPPGGLLVNGKRFELTREAGTETFVLPRLSCTGETDLPLEVRFEGADACEDADVFDAACSDEECLPLGIELGARP